MTVNKRNGHFSSFSHGFRKLLSRSDVALPRQTENDRAEQLRNQETNGHKANQVWHKSWKNTGIVMALCTQNLQLCRELSLCMSETGVTWPRAYCRIFRLVVSAGLWIDSDSSYHPCSEQIYFLSPQP